MQAPDSGNYSDATDEIIQTVTALAWQKSMAKKCGATRHFRAAPLLNTKIFLNQFVKGILPGLAASFCGCSGEV